VIDQVKGLGSIRYSTYQPNHF